MNERLFGNSTYDVFPTEEGLELLMQQAQVRIETIDGVDHLDGWPLPPDNETIHGPEAVPMRFMILGMKDGKGTVETVDTVGTSTITNSFIREQNMRCIVQGIEPIFPEVGA
jgi:hypothetical protein